MWMRTRTRIFLIGAAGILVAGLGTGLVASYMGLPNFALIAGDGPTELEYVPADAHIVAYANVREVMASDLRQKFLSSRPADSDNDHGKFYNSTGINIETDIDHVVASLSGSGGNMEHPLVLARGRFDAVRIEDAARQEGGRAEDYKNTRMLMLGEGGDELAVGFVEPDLMAFGSIAGVRRAIDTKASGADVKSNDDLMRIVRDIDDGNAWAVARFDAVAGRAGLSREIASQLPQISWFAASGSINGGLHGLLRAETRDDAAAQDLRQVLQGFMALARMQTRQRPEFTELMNSLQLAGDGKTVSLAFSIPPEVIGALSAMRPDARELQQPEAQPNPGDPQPDQLQRPVAPAL